MRSTAHVLDRFFGAIVCAGLVALSLWTHQAHATTIEGFKPNGQFQTVGLDAAGRFKVATDSGALQHVYIDGGTVAVVNDGNTTLAVAGLSGGPITVNTDGAAFTVQPATASTLDSSQGTNSGAGGAFSIYGADADRLQAIICNDSDLQGYGTILHLGDAGVTTSNGLRLRAGLCGSLDSPGSYIGAVFGASSAPVSWSTIRVVK